jgi:hypothetical protein
MTVFLLAAIVLGAHGTGRTKDGQTDEETGEGK